MSNESNFQIVCTNCGCLSIKIQEPVKSSREAIVYCGDCGASRGTVGSLRDLAVQGYPDVAFPTLSSTLSSDVADEQPSIRISTQYAELRRLRQQVKIAEWLASETNRPHATKRIRNPDTKDFALAHRPKGLHSLPTRDQKRPS